MTDVRSKAAIFRAHREQVRSWVVDGWSLEAIANKLKELCGLELNSESLRTYIRREFKCGTRELANKFSHEKKNIPSESKPSLKPAVGTDVGDGIEGVEPELRDLLDKGNRVDAVSPYFNSIKNYKKQN
ncbi:hypothetical protein ACLHZ0_19960 [Aeromonas salmonicida]|uniref:hypothetical protein n=1 Tax=Aeromonas salmonicida TaxID=645 RepID=UPI003D04684F